jgi:hypothetical protein
MAECYGSIGPLQKVGNRLANNVTTAKDHSALPSNIDFGLFKEHHDPLRSAGDKVWFARPFGKFSDIEGVEAINVFEGGDS